MQQAPSVAEASLPEITLRGIVLGVILAIILAASNTYLALKIGILTSASIPAAVIAMGVLRFFKNSNILENNLVQTAASAGEAIAGGIVYTIPALIIIQYWTHFGYWHNFFIALVGGVLGVLFCVPLRSRLMKDKQLRFPEAQAITRVLEIGERKKDQLRYMLSGGLLGGILEFAQSGLQVVASNVQAFFAVGKTVFGFGTGLSATLIGAGYLIGFNVGVSLLIGAVLGWLVLVPLLSGVFHLAPHAANATAAAQAVWGNHVRFIAIGSLLAAGVWTLLTLLKPIWAGMRASWQALQEALPEALHDHDRRNKDIPLSYAVLGILASLVVCYNLFAAVMPFAHIQGTGKLLLESVLCVLIMGFIFSAVCGYFSGLVGVTASPGSAIVIGGLLLISFAVRAMLEAHQITLGIHSDMIAKNACAVVIIIISVVTGIACIANDNIQDLKVGYLVGSTPWKQQVMLLIGVVAASAVIPLVMQLLFSVYGLGGVYPHAGMDPSKMLPAPVPAVLAAVTQAVFAGQLPLGMLLAGAGVTLAFVLLNYLSKRMGMKHQLSVLGVAIGLYLPLASSTPLFLGSLIALIMQRYVKKRNIGEENARRGVLLACGLVAGAALMDVLLAIPFAIAGNPDVLAMMPAHLHIVAVILGILSVFILARVFYDFIHRP